MGKRITELEETSQLSSGDFVMVGNDTVGDSKFDLGAMAENTYTKDDVDELLSQKSDAAYIAKLFGVKNLIPYPYYHSGLSPYSDHGIIWTDNGDGTITASGEPSGSIPLFMLYSSDNNLQIIEPGQKYILSLEVQNGVCSCELQFLRGASTVVERYTLEKVRDTTAEIEFTALSEGYTKTQVFVCIDRDTAEQTDVVIKPMLRLAPNNDSTWQSYINPDIGNYLLEDGDGKDNVETFTSSDVADGSATEWTSVSALTTGEKHSSIFAKISQVFKNVRFLWKLIGNDSFSNVASTLSGAIGNTALTTTAQTLSGAIVEHESDISTLNSNITTINGDTPLVITAGANIVIDPMSRIYLCGNKYLYIAVKGYSTAAITNAGIFTFSGNKNVITPGSVAIGLGNQWGISSVGYGYLNAKSFTATIPNGMWFHINMMIPTAA